MSRPERDPDPFPATTLHVRGAVDGATESVDWIVRRFTPLLLAQARYRLRGRMAAICDPEDVVNDVWLAVLPRLERIQPRVGRYTPVLVAFLGTTVLNRVNTLVRKHLRGKPRSSELEVSKLPAATQTVVSEAVRNEEGERVLQAIEALDDLDREVLILGAIEQRSSAEVGAAIGAAAGTARVRLHRALGRLREKLPDSVFEELETEPPDEQ